MELLVPVKHPCMCDRVYIPQETFSYLTLYICAANTLANYNGKNQAA